MDSCRFQISCLLVWGCLAKYHAADQLDIDRTGCTEYSAKDLYKLAAEAAKEVMDNGPYKLYTSGAYSDGRGAYRELFIADKAVTTE